MKPLTHVASKWPFFGCDLLVEGYCELFLEVTVALARCIMSCTCNNLIATVYLQWFTCDGSISKIASHIVCEHSAIKGGCQNS